MQGNYFLNWETAAQQWMHLNCVLREWKSNARASKVRTRVLLLLCELANEAGKQLQKGGKLTLSSHSFFHVFVLLCPGRSTPISVC